MTLDTTLSGTNSNSYVTLEEAEELLSYVSTLTVVSSFLSSEENEKKEKMLIQSAALMNELRWRGSAAVSTQSLAWPRKGIPGDLSSSIPKEIKRGQAVYATFLFDDLGRWLGFESSGEEANATKKVKISDFEIEFHPDRVLTTNWEVPYPVKLIFSYYQKDGERQQRRIQRG